MVWSDIAGRFIANSLHRRGVEVEEVSDALGVVRELLAVGLVHKRIEVLVDKAYRRSGGM